VTPGAPPERSATGGGTPTERGPAAAIPDKIYFKIGEVARLTGVKPYVLRYWETEFHAIQPVKSQSRQRLYRKRDVELLLKIKDLLYRQRFTIEGARKRIRELFGDFPLP